MNQLTAAFYELLTAHTKRANAEEAIRTGGATRERSRVAADATLAHANALAAFLEAFDGATFYAEREFTDALHRDLTRSRRSAAALGVLADKGFADDVRQTGAAPTDPPPNPVVGGNVRITNTRNALASATRRIVKVRVRDRQTEFAVKVNRRLAWFNAGGAPVAERDAHLHAVVKAGA
jgi:hypothetical protein